MAVWLYRYKHVIWGCVQAVHTAGSAKERVELAISLILLATVKSLNCCYNFLVCKWKFTILPSSTTS